MTDAELIARLRGGGIISIPARIAADRIEALVKERDQWIEHTKNAVWADSEELKLANARAERLVAAGKAYREATRHLKPCPETSAVHFPDGLPIDL